MSFMAMMMMKTVKIMIVDEEDDGNDPTKSVHTPLAFL